jgi:hypothetical protein
MHPRLEKMTGFGSEDQTPISEAQVLKVVIQLIMHLV